MYFCLRVDLDYVPWDTPDAKDFGHGEPAVFLRLLELARNHGYRFHFFCSNRSLTALPAIADAILNEGHDLDWLCKPIDEAASRFAKARELFAAIGSPPLGMACKVALPEGTDFEGIETLKFVSAPQGPVPPGLILFPVDTKNPRESIRAGGTIKSWTDSVKLQIRDSASRRRGVTVVVRPQVLGRYDPKLNYLREMLGLVEPVGLEFTTLRQLVGKERTGYGPEGFVN